jgi:hypothetical protein
LVVCVRNRGFPAALELRKVYRVLPDPVAAARSLLRVVDESGESYLYPKTYFVALKLSSEAARMIERAETETG